jgi:hypothetical protein
MAFWLFRSHILQPDIPHTAPSRRICFLFRYQVLLQVRKQSVRDTRDCDRQRTENINSSSADISGAAKPNERVWREGQSGPLLPLQQKPVMPYQQSNYTERFKT